MGRGFLILDLRFLIEDCDGNVAIHLEICHGFEVSTIVEIQEAIQKLPAKEKKALSAWLSSQDDSSMTAQEEAALLASLDRAASQLDAGQGVQLDAVLGLVRQWVSK